MGIYRTTNPVEFDDVDGIIINESAPAPNVAGVPANTAILVGQFQRGQHELTLVGSIGELHELYGKSSASGNLALKNKKFGMLKVIRVEATDSVKATKTFPTAGAVDIITFTAKHKGVYGNLIKVTVETGSTAGKKYTVEDLNVGAVLPKEVYDNVAIASVTSATFAGSKLVDVTVDATSADPANAAATALATGAEGTVADADYLAAIAKSEVEGAGNILFLDAYNATRNGYLKTSMANTQDKMCIVCGLEGDSRAQAVTDSAGFRDVDGRIIYAFPWVQTTIDGVSVMTNPASWLASIISQTAPNIDPAYAKNIQYMAGATALKLALTRADYIALKDAGICAFEKDDDLGGFKPKSGVVTQIADTSKLMISRRRMADYLTASVAKYLKNFQNAPNTVANRTAVKAAMLSFIEQNEGDGLLPRDSEVASGKAKLVDTESLNTNNTIAQGFFKILWKQRIHSSMRFIVIQAEIGEAVVVTESN